ncbi:MAG: BON domain-containing protein [Sulfuriferula sp.]
MHCLHKIASVAALLLAVNTHCAYADTRSYADIGNHKLDANTDERVSVEEALAATMPIRLFESADANHDGYLNAVELSYALAIKPPAAAFANVDDSAVTAKVKTAFLQNPILKTLHIHVATKNGIVQLTGVVGKQNPRLATAQIATAGQVAAGVGGVQQVVNSLLLQG